MIDRKIRNFLADGRKCVYDVPEKIQDLTFFESLIYGFLYDPQARVELWGQPKILGLLGPMYNGTIDIDGEEVTVIRYEKPEKIR